jgi:hypothetical protein
MIASRRFLLGRPEGQQVVPAHEFWWTLGDHCRSGADRGRRLPDDAKDLPEMSTRRRSGLTPLDQEWGEARRRHGLSHAHVQMARELGMNPKKVGPIANHRQEQWKAPLPAFIEDLYWRRFGRKRPEVVMSIEQRAAAQWQRKAERRATRATRRAGDDPEAPGDRPR